jgi:hypothetical protein
MMTWLMRTAVAPSMIESLLTFQITGSPVPALLTLAAPMLRTRFASQGK